jgi:hypothetical protein
VSGSIALRGRHQESAHFALKLRLSGLNIYELLNSQLPVQYHGSSASAACRVLTVRIQLELHMTAICICHPYMCALHSLDTTPSASSGAAALAAGRLPGLSASTGAYAAAPAAAAIAAAPAAAHHAPVLLRVLLLSVGADDAAAAVRMHCTLPVQLHAASQCKLLGKLRCAASTDRNSMLMLCWRQALASVLTKLHW